MRILWSLWDLIEALGVSLVSLAMAALSVFKIPLVKLVLLGRYLLPAQLLSLYVKGRLGLFFGNTQIAVVGCKQVLAYLEKELSERELNEESSLLTLMMYIYEELCTLHLSIGQIDEAAGIVLRAYGATGFEALPRFPHLNTQAAHIVKAGLAAGRLLDEGGFKDLFQSGKPIIIRTGGYKPKKTEQSGAPAFSPSGEKGKVIPFRRRSDPAH